MWIAPAGELCEGRVHQVAIRNRHITVFSKGSKERAIPFSARTSQAIWRYLTTRPEAADGDPLFATLTDGPIDRHDLRKTFVRVGERAGVEGVFNCRPARG